MVGYVAPDLIDLNDSAIGYGNGINGMSSCHSGSTASNCAVGSMAANNCNNGNAPTQKCKTGGAV